MLRKPRLFPLLLIVFGVAMLPVSKAQSPDARSLNDCIGYALDNNPQIRIAQLQLADSQAQLNVNYVLLCQALGGGWAGEDGESYEVVAKK